MRTRVIITTVFCLRKIKQHKNFTINPMPYLSKKEVEEKFDEQFWYDTPNLKLRKRNIPVFDEDDKLLGLTQREAAVPRDINSFISQIRLADLAAIRELVEENIKTVNGFSGSGVVTNDMRAFGQVCLLDVLSALTKLTDK